MLLSRIKDNYNKPPFKTILIILTTIISLVIGYWMCVILTCIYSSIIPLIGCRNEPNILCGCSKNPTTFYVTYFFLGIFSSLFTIIWVLILIAILTGVYYGIYLVYKLCYKCYKQNSSVEVINDSIMDLPA